MVIFTVGIALYGLRLFLVTRDGNENQDEIAVSADDASEKEALVPVDRGRSRKEINPLSPSWAGAARNFLLGWGAWGRC